MTLSEVIILIITATNHGPILPAFHHHHASHSRRSDPVTLYTTHHARHAPRSIIIPATGSREHRGQGARNLFVGRRAMAVVGHPTQPDSQPKSISVALQTARQNPFWCLSCDPASCPPLLRPSVAPLLVSLYSYWTSSMPSFFAVCREEVS
jgi:hypothetical protein